ncbi:MAG TPA: M50 family metallopeptidase [Blastocatellia bacterium]|nr:M50 family metallopeptidase [Blastocatellia bacterium]
MTFISPALDSTPFLLLQSHSRVHHETTYAHLLWLNRYLVGAAALTVILWYVPILQWVVYPFRFFVVYIHEASHCLAALLTGGGVRRFTLHPLHPEYRGLAYTYGGSRTVVTSAGYIGSVICGGLLLVLSSRTEWVAPAFIGLGLFVLVFTIFYARNFFAVLFGLIIAGAFCAIIYFVRPFYADLTLQFLAIQCCFESLSELVGIFRLSRDRQRHSDATIMRDLTGIPALFWAGLWSVISLAVLAFALRYALHL